MTTQYQCFSGVFSVVSVEKTTAFFRSFCNALTVKTLQNQRESRIYGQIYGRGFYLLKY